MMVLNNSLCIIYLFEPGDTVFLHDSCQENTSSKSVVKRLKRYTMINSGLITVKKKKSSQNK